MKSLLIVGLAVGLSACSDSKQKEATINSDKESSPPYGSYRKLADSIAKESISLSNNGKEAELSGHSNQSLSQKLLNFAEPDSSINHLSYSPGSYIVNKNDTLMKIAFEIYGDYEKWRVIKNSNLEKIDDANIIKEGMTLTFPEPDEKFFQNKKGDPYLIKSGDTLTSISKNIYGSSRHWKAIWKNNKSLIKDPNKIFAGFTIYIPAIKSL